MKEGTGLCMCIRSSPVVWSSITFNARKSLCVVKHTNTSESLYFVYKDFCKFSPESLGKTSTLHASLVVSEMVEPYGSRRTGRQSMLPKACSAAAPVEMAHKETHEFVGGVSDLKQQVGGMLHGWPKVNCSLPPP